MRRAEIEEQNRYLLKQQHRFRLAADVVTDALVAFPEVEAVAVIGSVAKPLWKEVPRFREYRRAGIEVWHECKDLDLAVWLSSQHRLGELRRTRDLVLRDADLSVANHQVEILLIEPGTDRYLGRLCNVQPAAQRASPSAVFQAAARSLSTRSSTVLYPSPICSHRSAMRCSTSGAKGGCVRRSTCRRLRMAVRCPVANSNEVVPMWPAA